MKRSLALLLILAALLSLSACAQASPVQTPGAAEPEQTPAASPAVADASQMTTVEEVLEEGMVPVTADNLVDGEYEVAVKASSSMFRIEKAVLHVQDGAMSAVLTMSGKSYLYVYPGSAPDAASAAESDWIAYQEDGDGAYTFTIPVEALDAPVSCAAFSKNKQLWYDRTLCFRADSLPTAAFREGFFVTAKSLGLADGRYMVAVTLSGGSGRASVQSPTALHVKDGACTAVISWSSQNYDYMKVEGEQILPLLNGDSAAFEIPVRFFDRPMPVIADTVAMSEPHEISYTLRFDSASLEATP